MVSRRTVTFFVNEQALKLPTPDQAEIRFGGVEHQEVAARLAALRGHDPDEYRTRLRSGHWVIYAIGGDGDLQSWGWVTVPAEGPRDLPWEFGVHLRIRPGSGYLWDYITMPAYRGRGLYKALVSQSAEQCFLRGAKRVCAYIELSNTAPRRGIVGAGYVEQGAEVRLQRIGPFYRVSRPGFNRTVRIGGVLELDALLPPG